MFSELGAEGMKEDPGVAEGAGEVDSVVVGGEVRLQWWQP